MNFKIFKRDFLDTLNTASKAISATTPLPSLGGIKLSADHDNLTIISSDSNISIRSVLQNNDEKEILTIIEEGEIVIEAKYLVEIVRKMDTTMINVETVDGTLVRISGGNSEFKINGMPAVDYPNIDFAIRNQTFELNTAQFIKTVEQTSFACSDKDTRPILTGVNFKAKDGKLFVNATDSYRLASKTIDIAEGLEFNITIPSKYLNDIAHSFGSFETVTLSIDEQKVFFMLGNTLIQTRLLDDSFPDVSRLIPSSFTQEIVINGKELLNAVDRSSFIKSDGKNVIKMSINESTMDITSSNNVSSSYENISLLSFEGTAFEVSCSGKYLSDAIKAIDNNEVTISFSGGLKPMIVSDKNDRSVLQLISPVRTYN